MPMYEYECRECKTTFEKLVKSMDEKPVVECPACKSKKTSRRISAFAVTAGASKSNARLPAKGCGRCGGPGPCAFE